MREIKKLCVVSMITLLLVAVTSSRSAAMTSGCAGSGDNGRSARLATIVTVLQGKLNSLNQQLISDPNHVSTRDLSNGALFVLDTGGSVASSEALLQQLFQLQNMDTTSANYGTIPWSINDPTVQDPNSIEFAMQSMGAIVLAYGNNFSDSFKATLPAHVTASLAALKSHVASVDVSYTNIYLMNTINTILLAQYVGDQTSLQRGYSQWQQWWNYTQQNGTHEFDSPTYFAVDLNDLLMGYDHISDPAIRQQVSSALDYFWRDISANYLVAAQHIAGAHSRDYDFLHGHGGMDFYLYLEGLQTAAQFSDVYLEKVDLIENERVGGYRPSQSILALAQMPERVIEQHWDTNSARTRYTYLTQDFAIGTASGNYNAQDKFFAADLKGSQPLVSIQLVPDIYDAPYGLIDSLDSTGHSKPTHLPLNLSVVQEKGLALMVADLDPAKAYGVNTYATDLVLPSHADDLILDGKALTVSLSLNQTAQVNSVLGIREGNSCFAARFYQVESLNSKAPIMQLKADSVGLTNGAIRLAIYHSTTSFSSTNTNHLHVGVLVLASACTDTKSLTDLTAQLQNATVTFSNSGSAFTASAIVGSTQLDLTESFSSRLPTTTKVNGVAVNRAVFSVNGTSMALQ